MVTFTEGSAPRRQLKRLTYSERIAVETEVKSLLLKAIRAEDSNSKFNLDNLDAREAFGIMRGLNLSSYGYFGVPNLDAVKEGKEDYPEQNLTWWFEQLKEEVRKEFLTYRPRKAIRFGGGESA